MPRQTTPRLLEYKGATEKPCLSCKQVLPMNEFYARVHTKGLINPVVRPESNCVQCCSKNARQQRSAKQTYTDTVKLTSGCIDCGYKEPYPEVYDFDHLPEFEKTYNIARLLTSGTLEQIKEEIAKCEVVCANCHRIRTRQRSRLS